MPKKSPAAVFNARSAVRAACCAAALTSSCHTTRTTGEPLGLDAGQHLRPIWGTSPLCEEGFRIGNLAVPGATLTAKNPGTQGGARVVQLIATTSSATYADVWTVLPGESEGSYSIRVVEPPGHYLSDALDAHAAQTGDEGSEGPALEWVLRRAGSSLALDDFEQVSFQLIPARFLESALEAQTKAPFGLKLGAIDSFESAARNQLWTLTPVPLCP